MSTENEICELYNFVEPLVASAGQYMREGYQSARQKNVEVKTEFYDLVTIYDKKIEELLVNGIKKKYPHHKFIGEEESAENKRTPILTDEPTWIIDPIDGTTNFIRKIPHACISIALSVKQEIVLGIVYNPTANEMYTAKKNQGAFLNGEKIQVNNCKKMNDAVVGYEISLIHAPAVRDKNIKRLYKLGSQAQGTRSFGSAALSLCYLASGAIDIYHIEDLKPWDMAAGAIIIREAGGIVLNPKGGEFDVMQPNIVSAATKELAAAVIALIEEANEIAYIFV